MFGWTLAARNLTFEEIMGDLKKDIVKTDFEGKSLQGYTWEKWYPAMEKISLMTYLMLKKNLTPLYVRKKILTSETWEKVLA